MTRARRGFAIMCGMISSVPASAAPVDVPTITTVKLEPIDGDVCQSTGRHEPPSTCKRLVRQQITGVGTFEVYDLESWHWLWIVIRSGDHVVAGELGDYGSRSSAGTSRTVRDFVPHVRRFAYEANDRGKQVTRVEAGLLLDFEIDIGSEHQARPTTVHERVFATCGEQSCRVVGFGYPQWDKHACTTTGWAGSEPDIAYSCLLELRPGGVY